MASLIVTGCDAKYFSIVQGLLESLASYPALREQSIGFLDAGLTDDQRRWLASRGVLVRTIGWDHDFPVRQEWEARMPGFKVMVARPQIRDHFPGFDAYLWMDADTWVQRGAAVSHLLSAAAASRSLVAVPEVDRSYFKFVRGPQAWWAEHQAAVACQGETVARAMQFLPTINAGLFALHAAAPHWDAYQKYLIAGLNRIQETTDQTRVVEQTALNAAVYADQLPVLRFPSAYNWLACLAIPYWDLGASSFVEPSPPYGLISVLHLSIHVLTRAVAVPLLHAGRVCGTLQTPLSQAAARGLADEQGKLLAAVEAGLPHG
jgi:hypothetical protein